jgi:hypothetical protein
MNVRFPIETNEKRSHPTAWTHPLYSHALRSITTSECFSEPNLQVNDACMLWTSAMLVSEGKLPLLEQIFGRPSPHIRSTTLRNKDY